MVIHRDPASAASTPAAGTSSASRQDAVSVTSPTRGETSGQVSALPAASQPTARNLASWGKAPTPENPAVSRPASPAPTSTCAARKIPIPGASATTAVPARLSPAPATAIPRIPMRALLAAAAPATAVTSAAAAPIARA